MADAFQQFEPLLRENLSGFVQNGVIEDDDPAWNLIDTIPPEPLGGKREFDTASSDYPPGYEVKYRIKVQIGGRISGGSFVGNTMVMMGKDSHLAVGQGADALYLDPRETPQASYIPIAMVLKRIRGSVVLNDQQFWADVASNPIEQVVGDYIEDATRRYRGYIINHFYGDGTASLAQVNGATVVPETAGGITVALKGNGTFAKFFEGDLLVAGSDANPRVQRAGAIAGKMRVVAINPDLRTIKLQSQPGEGNISLSDSDHLMYEGSYVFGGASHAVNSRVPQGVESLLINTGTFPGSVTPTFASGLDVTHHTALMSFIQDTTSSPEEPSMENMTTLLDKMIDIRKRPPAAWIAESSVWSRYGIIERENNAIVQVPMGALFEPAGGIASPIMGHKNFRFQDFSSARIRPQSILGFSPESFRKFMPMGDRTIHWVYGTGTRSGFASIFGPVSQGVQLTEMVDAPFNGFCEFGCLDPRANFRRLGVKNQRDN